MIMIGFFASNNFLEKNHFIKENWNGLNFLPQNASTVGLIDLKILPKENPANENWNT